MFGLCKMAMVKISLDLQLLKAIIETYVCTTREFVDVVYWMLANP
jgi:hypothetical protein